MVKFLDLKKQHLELKKELDEAVSKVVAESSFIKGKELFDFERDFANYLGVSHCISCANGTDALTALIKCLALPAGSSVILPANTFIATAEAVAANGLNIKFADIDDDFTISLESVETLMTEDVSAVIAVHLYGQPAKMAELKEITTKRKVALIEDAAQAHGAMYGRDKAGTLGDGATFSFYPGKVLGAFGDAGAIVVNNDDLAKKIRKYCDHGREEKYKHTSLGINSRMDTIQAAVLRVKLKYLEQWIEKRTQVAEKYFELLQNVDDLTLPHVRKNVRHAWHLFVIRHPKRDLLQKYLKDNGVETGIHYPLSLPEQPVFKDHLIYTENYSVMRVSSELLSLPMGEHLTFEEVKKVADLIKKFSLKKIF
ncbi:MAG: DegT/DnrJ/EryC1/StrS family aminotransferase [bacterium]